MPEGPEIRRSADALAQVLAGAIVREIRFALPHLQRHAAALEGKRIRAVEARGKAMLIRFAGGTTLYSHNQLYGEWSVYPGDPPQTHLQQRILIRTARGCAVLYSATEIELLDAAGEARHRYLSRLGPDVLDNTTTPARVRARLQSPAFARRRLAALLLEQGFLAGLGNYLRSEILFAARLHPDLRPADLDAAQTRTLATRILAISRRAYRTGGVTNDARLVKRLRAEGAAFSAYRHAVYERAGLPCYACGTTIVRIERSRAVFLCPHCQALPGIMRGHREQ